LESRGAWGVLFFDRLLAIALLYFAEQRVEYAILEVGVGGRYDPTNFIVTPSVAVITSISLDHMELLGDTLEKIAWQKAGIMKKGAPTVTCANHRPEVMKVFHEEAERVGCPLHIATTTTTEATQALTPQMKENWSVAEMVLRQLNIKKPDFTGSHWPGRFEIVSSWRKGPEVPMVILDVAHNKDSISKLLDATSQRLDL